MRQTTTVIIGAGQSGLAMSAHLEQWSIDHVILERGDVAHTWRTQRWDSLRLLTPNWQCRLPRYEYRGTDPDGYRTMPETIGMLEEYARQISAPIRCNTTVTSVRRAEEGYLVKTDQGDWRARTVVIASGACNLPSTPQASTELPADVRQISALDYRNPEGLDDGGVLIVGASATGVQLAAEIQASGRAVTLAVGEHVRVPRVYRGRDIKAWMDETGILDERFDEVDDIGRARRLPSLQLAGSTGRGTLDLNALGDAGVDIVGRLAGVRNGRVLLSGGLKNLCALADLKMNRLLDTIDLWAAASGRSADLPVPHRLEPTRVGKTPLALDLTDRGIRTVLWATGFRPDYSWLAVPVLDRKGRIIHDGGVVSAPGLYVMGLPLLRRRKSTLIDGADDDARDLSTHLKAYLDTWAVAA